MRKLLFLLIIVFFACSREKKEIPANVPPPATMKKILTDLLIANEFWIQKKHYIDSLQVNPGKSVLKKYGLDSVHFAGAMNFYAQHPDIFLPVLKDVEAEIKHRKDSLNKLLRVNRQEKKEKQQEKEKKSFDKFILKGIKQDQG